MIWSTCVSWESGNLILRIPSRERFKAFPWNEGREIPLKKSWHCQLLSWHQSSVPISWESVCSLAWCNLRLCITSGLVNRWWLCLCLCTTFQSNHYVMYQPLKLWFWYSTDTPLISFQCPCDQSVCRFSLSQEKIPHGQHCIIAHCQISHWPLNREGSLVKSGSRFNQTTSPFTLCCYNWLWRNDCYKCCYRDAGRIQIGLF